MEKFSEYVKNYKQWKNENHRGEPLDEFDMTFIRESYAAKVRSNRRMVESKRRPHAGRISESQRNVSLVSRYANWKLKEGLGKIDKYDLKVIRMIEKKEEKKHPDLSNVKGSMTAVLSDATGKINACKSAAAVRDAVEELFNDNEIDTKASQRLLDALSKAKTLNDAWFTVYNSILKGTGNGVLKDSKKPTNFQKALKEFAAYKESKGLGAVTRSERVRLFEKMHGNTKIARRTPTVKSVFDKLNESKKCVALATRRLSEGDVMGAADATMAAGQAVAGAEGDAAAMATPAAPVPQEVVDQISQVKTAVDALAAQAGIASPVDMGADPNAGVPAVTGAPADPNAADPNGMMESRMSAARARISEAKCASGKCGVEIPAYADLIKGTATGASKEAKPANTWPTEKIAEVPMTKKLGNVKENEEFSPDTEDKLEESKGLAEQRLEAEMAKRNFNWNNFLKSGFNKR